MQILNLMNTENLLRLGEKIWAWEPPYFVIGKNWAKSNPNRPQKVTLAILWEIRGGQRRNGRIFFSFFSFQLLRGCYANCSVHILAVTYIANVDYFVVFKEPGQEGWVLCKQGRGAQSYPSLEPKHAEGSPLCCSGLDMGPEGEKPLSPVNAGVYVGLAVVSFGILPRYTSGGFCTNWCVSLTTNYRYVF